MHELTTRNLTIGYENEVVIDGLTVRIPKEKITVIVGANGSGKSTLLKSLARVLAPFAGIVHLGDRNVHSMPTRELARQLSILPQKAQSPESLTVEELVSFGRYPHRRWLRGATTEDASMIDWAISVVGVQNLRDRPVNALSGGQQQRVWIAMTIAQGASIMLLDEPTSHLDTCHQLEVMHLLARLNREEGKTIVMVLHDLNLAARHADHMIALKSGQIVAAGPPEQIVTAKVLYDVFEIEAEILRDPRNGAPMCVPYAYIKTPTQTVDR
jgi:iron complex transport system ATP-binding protein